MSPRPSRCSTPNFFSNAPLVLALDKLPPSEGAVDLPGLMRVCRQHGLRTLAIRASRIEDLAAAIAIDIPVLPPSGARERPLEMPEAEAKKKELQDKINAEAERLKEEALAKKKELEDFIRRFSANVAKSKQATARQKMLEKLDISAIQPSSRRYPYIGFKPEREVGDQILVIENLSYQTEDGTYLFKDLNLQVGKRDKIAFLSKDGLAVSALFDILMGKKQATSGMFKWGVTITKDYLPNDNSEYFSDPSNNLVDWLRQYSTEKDETFIRGFLG